MHLRLLATTLLSATAAFAQNDFDLDKTSAGTLGSTLQLAVANAPANALTGVMMSFTGGPTAIGTFDPNDPRSVQVGLDLASAWFFTVTSGTGAASFGIGLPNDPSFTNLQFHWQTLTLATSGPTVVGEISNDVVTQCSVANTGLLAPAALAAGRAFSACFYDRNNNGGAGDVLIAGGGAGSLTAATGLQSTELWDFRHLRRVAGPNMTVARALHVAVTLADNRVLLIGGVDAAGVVLGSCEIYDPTTNTFTATGSLGTARVLHAACLLADGRVMTTGGTSSLVDQTTAITSTLSSTEFWSPTTGQWTSGPAIGGRRLGPALTRLSNNQVLVSGGVEVSFFLGVPFAAVSTVNCQRWNPTNNTWGAAGAMPNGRAGHHFNQVTLGDGRVLMTGGIYVPSLLGAASAAPIQAADVYNPATNTWTAYPMATSRALHSATRLADGRVAVCGGAQGTLTAPTSIAGVELFNPSTNSWSTLPNLTGPRGGHAAALLPDGTLMLFGGQDLSGTTATVEALRF